jgi:hypothetical protein
MVMLVTVFTCTKDNNKNISERSNNKIGIIGHSMGAIVDSINSETR